MNLKISPVSFKAWYIQKSGKSTVEKTAKNYDSVIAELERRKKTVIQAKQYMDSYQTQEKIYNLPDNRVLYFYNIRLWNQEVNLKNDAEVPYLSYEPLEDVDTWGDIEAYKKMYKRFYFEADRDGNIDTKKADEWLDSLALDCKA